ncbi:hypothetical protein BD311DRAFT_765080 [Dichomitus squalens]|uniref:Uncharacterized protein n=1 Tax=Dichomitus squalens TaxID=114155 RepID=A0A4Q9MD40_9APHY|nr:hypothetical protein BD311DRAFT_765080 [Dichomitus squalens]
MGAGCFVMYWYGSDWVWHGVYVSECPLSKDLSFLEKTQLTCGSVDKLCLCRRHSGCVLLLKPLPMPM